MTVVVDASVALKWFIDEEDSEAALLLVRDHDCVAPDFLLVEVRNAILTKVRNRNLSPARALEIEGDLESPRLAVIPTTELLPQAFALGLELDHPIYDCIYLAAVFQLDRQLVTADRRFFTVVQGSDYAERVALLSEFPSG